MCVRWINSIVMTEGGMIQHHYCLCGKEINLVLFTEGNNSIWWVGCVLEIDQSNAVDGDGNFNYGKSHHFSKGKIVKGIGSGAFCRKV